MSKLSSLTVFFAGILFILIMMSGVTACSGSEHVTEDDTVQQRDLAQMEELYWARIDSSRMNFTQADVDFMTAMIAHHAQALLMSRLATENGAGRSVHTLAARIINAQGDEIELMQNWLRDRGQPVPEVHIDGMNLNIHGLDENGHDGLNTHHTRHNHHDMPGMLSPKQLEELAEAKGNEFDRKFLEFMIEHHKGAVMMVEELFSVDGAALDKEAFELASGINAEQITEIDRMRSMLKEKLDS